MFVVRHILSSVHGSVSASRVSTAEVTPITYWSGLGKRVSVRVRLLRLELGLGLGKMVRVRVGFRVRLRVRLWGYG